MKKIILTVISLAVALVLTGCAGAGGNSLENVDIENAVDASTIKADDYDDNLEGLEKYLTALNYIPEKSEPTEMMYSVIGAKDGDRYNYTVNKNSVYIELYEYDPTALNDDGKRVIEEIQKNGKFYVFDDKSIDDNVAVEAELSYNGKYVLVYNGSTASDDLSKRKEDFIKAVKEFHQS